MFRDNLESDYTKILIKNKKTKVGENLINFISPSHIIYNNILTWLFFCNLKSVETNVVTNSGNVKSLIKPEILETNHHFRKLSGYSQKIHGAMIYILNSDELAVSLHSSKKTFKLANLKIENVAVNEDINPIQFVNPPLKIRKIDFNNIFEIEEGFDSYFRDLRYGGVETRDLFYCFVRAFVKSISTQVSFYEVECRDLQLGIERQSNVFISDDTDQTYTPIEIGLIKASEISENQNSLNELVNEIFVIPKEDQTFKEDLLTKYNTGYRAFFENIKDIDVSH